MRWEIQASRESVRALAVRFGINTKTVRKWRNRTDVRDARLGPRESASTVLSAHEEGVCVRFRQASLLPLDDCLYQHGIRHQVAGPPPGWTNNWVAATTNAVTRISKRLRDARLAYYQTREQARKHMDDFVVDVIFVKRLKILDGRTPYQHLCKLWAIHPEQFKRNSMGDTLGTTIVPP